MKINTKKVEENQDCFIDPIISDDMDKDQFKEQNVGYDWRLNEKADETFSEGLSDQEESIDNKKPCTDLELHTDCNFSDVSLAEDERKYEIEEFNTKIQPILTQTTQEAVSKAVKYQHDKLKLEVNEVLQDEVGYHLSKYEKRRKRRDIKDTIISIIKFCVLIVIVLFILGNNQLRSRFIICFRDIGEMITGLVNGEEVTSNQLVEDLFKDMGNDLNEINTVEKESTEEQQIEGTEQQIEGTEQQIEGTEQQDSIKNK